MNRLNRRSGRGRSWQRICRALLTSGLTVCWIGSASAALPRQESDARTDSLTTAFFLLKFDTDVERARMLATAKVDSLHISGLESALADARKQRYRDMLTFGIAAAFAGVIFYLGGRASQ